MAEPLRPASSKTYGKKNWVFVPTISASTNGEGAAPSATEATAASTLDVTLMALADAAFTPTKSTNRAKQNRRYGDTKVYEFIGETSWEGGEFGFAVQPQAAAGADGKKALEKFTEGTTGFMVQRLGVARSTALAAGQFVNVYPVEVGPCQITEAGDGESAEAAGYTTIAVTGEPAMGVAITA